LIGLWCAQTWRQMGAPRRAVLAELGPGRGTLMCDALRAARIVPDFLAAIELHLVETSPMMRGAQSRALANFSPAWHALASDLPAGPLLLVANEFLDVLPIRQFVRAEDDWRERRVGVTEDGERFVFVLDTARSDHPLPAAARAGAIQEVSPLALELAAWLGPRLARDGGAALFIDYGHGTSAPGETLQSLRGHRRHDVLDDPGIADLTAHVDFAAFSRAAEAAGARALGPMGQGEFLLRLGIEARARRLLASASERQAGAIEHGYRRLLDPAAMGSLFKVLALADPALPPLAGFETRA